MISKLNQLKNKKGFTFVELIVVLAIIAIMLGVLIPLLSVNQALEDEVKDYAKAFYSNAQELLMDERARSNPLPATGTDFTSAGSFSLVSVTVYGNGVAPVIKFGKLSDYGSLPTIDPTSATDPWAEFAEGLTKLEKYNGKDLFYTAIVDCKYRVVKTYCSLKECTEIWGVPFSDNYYVGTDKILTASYPRTYCEAKDDGTFPIFGAWDD